MELQKKTRMQNKGERFEADLWFTGENKLQITVHNRAENRFSVFS